MFSVHNGVDRLGGFLCWDYYTKVGSSKILLEIVRAYKVMLPRQHVLTTDFPTLL
jgi:hypothetical protein